MENLINMVLTQAIFSPFEMQNSPLVEAESFYGEVLLGQLPKGLTHPMKSTDSVSPVWRKREGTTTLFLKFAFPG